MKNVISFSGGRTSAFMTLEVLKIHPEAEVIFMDTGAEHPKRMSLFATSQDISMSP